MFCILILILTIYTSIYSISDIKHSQYLDQKEQNLLEYRKSIEPIIRDELKSLIQNNNASRASFFEFHKGKSNNVSLRYLYVSMTYEETKDWINKVSSFYQDINTSLFNISSIVYEKGYWNGSIKDLQKIDPILSQTILSNSKTKYIYIYLLEDSSPQGFLVLSFNQILSFEKQKIISQSIQKSSVYISNLLNLYE